MLKKETYFLIFIFIFSFLLRALFFISFLNKDKNYFTGDWNDYNTVALQIYENNKIANSSGEPQFLRLPLYPIFLGLNYKLFGKESPKTLWVQIFLASFIPVLIYILAQLIFNNFFVSCLSSFISSVHLGYIFFSGILMSESLFLILFLLFLILFFKNNFFYSGLTLGLASLVRPVGLYLIILSIFIIFLKKYNLKIKFKNIFKLFISWLLVISPWVLRNYLLTGFIFLTSFSGQHFYTFTANYIYANVNKVDYVKAKQDLQNIASKKIKILENNKNRRLYCIEKCKIYENLSINYILKHPGLFIKHASINILKTMLFPFFTELYYVKDFNDTFACPANNLKEAFSKFYIPKSDNLFLLIYMYLDLLIFLFLFIGFCGFIILIIINNNFLKYLDIFLIYLLFIFITLACGYPRLRLPVEGFIIILASYFYNKIYLKFYHFGVLSNIRDHKN
ncbi:MAG: Conserved membrane protein [candidate division TM6 bacterium GW2011_GWF2_28_16]|nr:MAG: Conserved membrane protein [candidate division TM6 bacterium GW2011_GWF2_28_16]